MKRSFIFILLSLLCVSIHAEEKYWVNQSRDNLSNLIFKSESVGWIISTQDKNVELLQSKDGGESWNIQYVFKSKGCFNLCFTDTLTGLIILQESKDTSKVYRTVDGGNTWFEIFGKTYTNHGSFFFFDSNIGWLARNGLYFTSDAGANWKKIHDSTFEFYNLQFTDLMTGWAVDNSQLIKTTDGGKTWTKLKITGTQFSFIDNNSGFLKNDSFYQINDSLYQTNDGGYTWKLFNIKNDFKYKYFTDTLNGYALNNNHSFVYKTYNKGKTWFPEDLNFSFNNFQIFDINHLWIIENNSKILRTSDAGKSWNNVRLGGLSINDLQTKDGKLAIAVGYNGYIGRSANGGDIWNFRADITKEDLKKVQMFDSVIYVLGSCGILLKSTDIGKNWNLVKVPDTIINSLYDYTYSKADCHFIDKNNGWIVGKDGVIIKTTNGGKEWTQFKLNADHLSSVFFFNKFDGFTSGYKTEIYDTKYGQTSKCLGKFYKTTDGGINWIDQNLDIFATKLVFVDRFNGFLNEGEYKFFKTTDGGLSWIQKEPIKNLIYHSFFALNKDYIWLSSMDGQFRTTNGGKNWQNLFTWNDPTFFLDTCTGWFGLYKTNNKGYRILEIPLLSSPSNNSRINKSEVDLVSMNLQTTINTAYEVALDPLFKKAIKYDTLNGYGKAVSKAVNLKYYQKYYWRVRAFDESDNSSEWSEIWNFIPVLDSLGFVNLNKPENYTEDIVLKPELIWSEVTYSDNYRLMISTDSLFNNIIIDTYLNSHSFIPISDLLEGQIYFWKVKAINKCDSTSWSQVWNFTTKKTSSIISNVSNNNYEIFPNPATDFIHLPETNELIQYAAIFSIFGEKVLQINNFENKLIDVSGLSKGIYFLRINGIVYKFVKM